VDTSVRHSVGNLDLEALRPSGLPLPTPPVGRGDDAVDSGESSEAVNEVLNQVRMSSNAPPARPADVSPRGLDHGGDCWQRPRTARDAFLPTKGIANPFVSMGLGPFLGTLC